MSKPESTASTAPLIATWQIDVVRQHLVTPDGSCWPVSTSRHGLGAQEGSHRTPPGWHRVAERIGDGEPVGTRFRSREPVGLVPPQAWASEAGEDAILTRIWWLKGLEPGVNRGPGIDSYRRYIYLHGTHQEQLLGTPASIGCVRLSNETMRALFDRYATHEVRVWIGAAPPPHPCP